MSNTLLYAAIVLSVLGLGLVVASWAIYWYDIATTILGGTSHQRFYWKKYTESGGGISLDHNYDSNLEPKTKQLFDTCLTLLTIGGAVTIGFIVLVGLRVLFFKKSGFIRWIGAIVGIVATVFLAVSFFAFLNLQQAFQDDYKCKNNQCSSFLGHTNNLKWGPGPGWWCLLGAIVLVGIATTNALRKARG